MRGQPIPGEVPTEGYSSIPSSESGAEARAGDGQGEPKKQELNIDEFFMQLAKHLQASGDSVGAAETRNLVGQCDTCFDKETGDMLVTLPTDGGNSGSQ